MPLYFGLRFFHQERVNPICLVRLFCLQYIEYALQNTLTMEANTMHPDQTAPNGAV